ncbi:multicopper oxidase domain-containing protein [Terrabacter sp. 2RAF25]|uniref:multicopper oxidase domain-containing protein n=1 Tax=Terrabacter sp. 2RAF25 TaxID=3232998 RepID=UPI003F9BA85A
MSRSSSARWFTAAVAGVATALALGMQAGMAPQTASASPPTSVTDSTKVPHYFGPWPNWANSPLTLPTATVSITDSGGGTGATAVAQVDPATGGIGTIDVTAPGHDYTSPVVTVTSPTGTGAAASAVVRTSGAVVSATVGGAGGGYSTLSATVTGDGTGASVVASGSVDVVTLTNGGSGYTMPTVMFDLPDDPNGTRATGHVDPADLVGGVVQKVIVDESGTGYSKAPGVTILNGTLSDPIAGATPATATATLKLVGLSVGAPGSGYTSATLSITDPTGNGNGATGTVTTDVGSIESISVTAPGAGYLTAGMKKFQDALPIACNPGTSGAGCPAVPQQLGTDVGMGAANKFIPLAVPEAKTYSGKAADEYVIGLVQYRTKFSRDLPATLVRGYVQLSTTAVPGQHVTLFNELQDGTTQPITGYTGVTAPQWLGPIISATKDRPVRIVFRNLLPKGADGDLFLPTDSTMMGSGMGPMAMAAPTNTGSVTDQVRNPDCTQEPKPSGCFKDNRATLHLHGGTTPWISDGTPHQWITPAGENTPWPEGVSVQNVPDMLSDPAVPTSPAVCAAKDDGCSTFYYTNQQSARLMFYHDHSWGITRLNVYAGEAAGYTITDNTEKALVNAGLIPAAGETLPLIVQDRTFVPGPEQLNDSVAKDAKGNPVTYGQDPTWDAKRWGTKGSFWYHHVYMPAQNPGDPGGMSAYGRWMYGPWFWPPATGTTYGPIANPYYDPSCNLDDPSTWQYQTDPFCEPEQIPGTPNVSAGMEQFNDTPIVNGVAYPTVTLQPKSYRLRMLNAANDRFFNFQWYTADTDPANGGAQGTEVKLKASELAAAQTDPTVSPTPEGANNDAYGPDWVQIANEGGFLPAPAVIDGQQPTTWITDPTRFDFGNVDKHSLLLAPAERADVIVDFSKFAGKTLILYNDSPAAFPARVPSYDYYTGAPDLSPAGAPKILPGYGPNSRTVMQVKIAATSPAQPFNMTGLVNAFKHQANGSGVFESGQHPVIVGQAAYNSAYGTSFAASSNCNVKTGNVTKCDGLVRVNDTGTFGFNTLAAPTAKMTMPLEPKAIHDEMNSTTFDEYGRMQANLGVEAQPPTPGAQNVTLYPYINPATELIDGTNLPPADVKVTPITNAKDGTQIWRFTHNGVDTHPIHFHLYDVQVLNRVTWDNIVIPPDANELGWKDTVRMSPLEDTIVALRPVVPQVPFEVPNAVRPLNPMMPLGDQSGFNNIDPQGNPTGAIVNSLVNMGWEYVIHCHILSHEEMDMMRPESVALPPRRVDGLTSSLVNVLGKNGKVVGQNVKLTWNDNSINETSFVVQRTTNGTTWIDLTTVASPLDQPNVHGARTYLDTSSDGTTPYLYRVVALNTVGYGKGFPSLTAQSISDTLGVNGPAAPTTLTAAVTAGPQVSLSWRDNATNESGFLVERSVNGGAFAQLATPPARATTGTATYVDGNVTVGNTYAYRVSAVNVAGQSAPTNTATVAVQAPAQPVIATATAARVGNNERVTVTWGATSGAASYLVQWSSSPTFATTAGQSASLSGTTTSFTTANLARQIWYVRVRAVNPVGQTDSAIRTVPAAP